MGQAPRILAVMGSGETSPTMVEAHRRLLRRLGPGPVPAVLLDTPFGFQANADQVVTRAVEYFRRSVGHEISVAGFRAPTPDPLVHEAMLATLREARFVFSGPGSPSYALRLWKSSLVPKLLAEKLESGGCLVFASAAALTLGVVTVPVYEIYKVGEDPHWLEGLDLLADAGLSAAVVPHYDNAEGGTHDTRFCYLGEHRLARMEEQLPAGAFVLGVDEHTCLVLDLDAGTASVSGLGGVTVRAGGRSTEIPSGSVLPIGELAALARLPATDPVAPGAPRPSGPAGPAGAARASPLLAAVDRYEAAFSSALEGRRPDDAVRAVLSLEEELDAWSADTLQSDEPARARAALRSMIARLGPAPRTVRGDAALVAGSLVELLLGVRARARTDGRWEDADAVRRGLAELGVEVQDTAQGTTWRLLG